MIGVRSIPKIIEDINHIILGTAKKQLLAEGYRKLTLRGVAKKCGIAVGTIYNYFPSKDNLVASVMADEWQDTLDRIKGDCAKAPDINGGFYCIYVGIIEFSHRYSGVWLDYPVAGSVKYIYPEQHKLLRSQITEIIRTLLNRFGKEEGEAMNAFLAESLLTVAMAKDMDFQVLETVIKVF